MANNLVNIFNKQLILSDPQPSWLFEVVFYKNTLPSKIEQTKLIAQSVTLPSFETETVTKKFFGSEKTFPVLRTYATDIDIKFILRTEFNDNKELYRISQLNARNFIGNNNVELAKSNSPIYPIHPELENYWSESGVWYYQTINKIEVYLYGKTLAPSVLIDVENTGNRTEEKGNVNYTSKYTYNNCILKNFKFDNDLDYTSDSELSCTLTFHSDIWDYENYQTTTL